MLSKLSQIYIIDPDKDPLASQEKIFGLPNIPFSSKMIKGLFHGKNSAIISSSREDLKIESPHKGDIYYVGEPFKRTYGWKDGMRFVNYITYQTDGQMKIIHDGLNRIESVSESFAPEAMLEQESRFFIQITQCGFRTFGSLKLSQMIHDNTYGIARSHSVYVIRFNLLSRDRVEYIINQRLREELFEQLS